MIVFGANTVRSKPSFACKPIGAPHAPKRRIDCVNQLSERAQQKHLCAERVSTALPLQRYLFDER
eukprot:537462-Amphidinium_carterae.1